MDTLIFTLHILLWPLCIVIVTLILLQGGAGDIASAFGGGGQLDSTLGVGASRKMAKLTGWLAAFFAVVVIFLAIPHKGTFKSNGSETSHTQSFDASTMPSSAAPAKGAAPSIVLPSNPSLPMLAPAPTPVMSPVPTATPAPAPAVAAPAATPSPAAGPLPPVAPPISAPAAPLPSAAPTGAKPAAAMPGAAVPAAPAPAAAAPVGAAAPANAPK